ncbi:MAG TPA: serine--tRNA ligase [Xanthobacteraceae bacterium]|nr:serine--tRNA ligase [Xanthobacteraceae bacterium]
MFDPKWVRDHPDLLDRGLKRRGLQGEAQRLISIDQRRRAIIRVLESWRERRNVASKEIGQAKAKKDEATIRRLMPEVAECKASISTLEAEQDAVDEELLKALAEIPNIPADDVPDGDASANKERHQHGKKRDFAFKPKLHFEIGEALGLMDFETARKISGSRFVVLKGGLARLERAIAQLFLDTHVTEHGYQEVSPPLLVRDDAMRGTGQLPKFVDDQFIGTRTITRTELLHNALKYATDEDKEEFQRGKITLETLIDRILERAPLKEDYWLIPTAEVSLTNLVRELIVEERELPMRVTAGTPCFRAEAGAAGKDTRGMMRQHQFTKVELVAITTPEQSEAEHERMLASAEAVLKKLDLHYRVVTLATGDMGFAAQKTYDIEVWLPGEGAYREISSVSNCGEFQARRMQARYRPKGDKHVRHVHTLNGSGVAVGRALIAVLENYQEADGSVVVPDALAPYMGGIKKIERAP